MAILSKACKPDKFELHNSLKHSFANIWGLRSNCVNLSLNQTLLTFLLCVRQIWIAQLFLANSVRGYFLCETYLPLAWKDSTTCMHGLAVYVKEGLPFVWDLPLESSADSYLCFRLDFFHSPSHKNKPRFKKYKPCKLIIN